jgi:hypothetical protein
VVLCSPHRATPPRCDFARSQGRQIDRRPLGLARSTPKATTGNCCLHLGQRAVSVVVIRIVWRFSRRGGKSGDGSHSGSPLLKATPAPIAVRPGCSAPFVGSGRAPAPQEGRPPLWERAALHAPPRRLKHRRHRGALIRRTEVAGERVREVVLAAKVTLRSVEPVSPCLCRLPPTVLEDDCLYAIGPPPEF